MENGLQEFLNNVCQVVGARKSPTVLCIVHSEAGLEILFNTNDMVMKLGMLDVARMTVVDQQAVFNQEHEEMVRRNEEMAALALRGGGKAN